jgi:hypothetical protein
MWTLIFLTYVKYNPETGKFYIGRTSGLVKELSMDAFQKVMRRRDNSHEKNKEGYEPAKINQVSQDYAAIRGQEQLQIDAHKQKGDCGNTNNGISQRNKKRLIYLAAAIEAFGEINYLLIAMNISF